MLSSATIASVGGPVWLMTGFQARVAHNQSRTSTIPAKDRVRELARLVLSITVSQFAAELVKERLRGGCHDAGT